MVVTDDSGIILDNPQELSDNEFIEGEPSSQDKLPDEKDDKPPEDGGEQGKDTPPTDDKPPQPKPKEKEPYTQEELEYVLINDLPVDSDRLTPEGKVLQKSFQRGYTRKFTELSQLRKEFEAQRDSERSPKDKLYSRYKANPASVVAEINQTIAELEELDPTDEHYKEARRKITQFNALKDEFALMRQQEIDQSRFLGDSAEKGRNMIVTAIPDFEEKIPHLTQFAMSVGLTYDDVLVLTNPNIMGGERAAKITIALNKLYDMINAGDSVEKKTIRRNPPRLNRSGAGSETPKGEINVKEIESKSMADYRAWREGKTKK